MLKGLEFDEDYTRTKAQIELFRAAKLQALFVCPWELPHEEENNQPNNQGHWITPVLAQRHRFSDKSHYWPMAPCDFA